MHFHEWHIGDSHGGELKGSAMISAGISKLDGAEVAGPVVSGADHEAQGCPHTTLVTRSVGGLDAAAHTPYAHGSLSTASSLSD